MCQKAVQKNCLDFLISLVSTRCTLQRKNVISAILIFIAAENLLAELSLRDVEEEKSANRRTGRPTFELWLTKRRDLGDGFWVFSSTQSPGDVYFVAAIGFCVQEGSIYLT
jgi:hypothetical protein